MKAAALIVAAGSGERLGAGRPKAFVALAGRPMVQWSLDAVRAAGIHTVVVAVPDGWPVPGERCVAGGDTRSESVRNALAALPADVEAVAVHDAARPLVRPGHFTAALEALGSAEAAIAAAPMTDTVKEAGADRLVRRTLDRSALWAVQTPQAFRREALERALDVPVAALAAATDDAALVEAAGGRVRIVDSSPENFKVTTPHDLLVAELLLGERRAGGASA
jgi:2-C-methyl-D-erythritol 4-phosphate cytidylyltransferase